MCIVKKLECRWEEACSVDRRMPAMQGLEDALARSKRRETLNGWHSSFRQMSMQRFAKRYWKLQQSPRGRSPSRRRRRSAGNKRPSAWSPAGNGSVGSPGVSPHRRKSDTALAAAQVAALFSTTSSMDPDVPDSKVAEFSIPAPTPELERLLHELDPKSKCLSSTEVVFATQVGSAMYNLATSASDEDYLIVFVKRSVDACAVHLQDCSMPLYSHFCVRFVKANSGSPSARGYVGRISQKKEWGR